MRDTLDVEMRRRGLFCMDIRNREVKKRQVDTDAAVLRVRAYEASQGTEYFLSFESEDARILFGFLRLRLTERAGLGHTDGEAVFPELFQCALIRELHVYGQVKKVKEGGKEGVFGTAQHRGFGTRLLEEACRIAARAGYTKIAVIAGVGVKEYYRKRGFTDEPGYGHFLVRHNLERDLYLRLSDMALHSWQWWVLLFLTVIRISKLILAL